MLYLLLSLLFGTAVSELPATEDAISTLTLQDQYGVQDSLAAHHGQVTVVMVVTAKRLRNIRPWEEALRERFDDVGYLRIAEVPDDSPADYQQVASKLAERVPDNVPVLIDMDRLWARGLELDTDRPNILVYDASGTLVASQRGKYSPEVAAEIITALESLVSTR